MNNGMNGGGVGKKVASPLAPGIIMLAGAVLSATCEAVGKSLLGVLFMILSAAMFALLICMRATIVCCVLCPVSVTIGTVIITATGGGIENVILFGSFVAVGGVLALCVAKKSDRTGTVVAMSGALALMILATFAAEYFSGGGSFSADGIRAFAEGKISEIRVVVGDMTDAYADTLRAMGQTVDEADVKALAENISSSFIALLSGLAIALLQIVCYAVTSVFKFSATKAHCEVILPSPRWELYPTMVTVVIYAVASVVLGISYLLALFSASSSVVQVVAYNLVLITSPVFAAIGIGTTMGRKNPAAPGRRGMSIFIFVIFFIFATQIAYTMISIVGAITVFVKRKAESAPKKDNDNDNGMM